MANINQPPQHQDQQPGMEYEMNPLPESSSSDYKGSGKLKDKIAIITGGDSGIGRAVAIAFAKEGADICITYLNENEDAYKTKSLVESEGRKCVIFAGDLRNELISKKIVEKCLDEFGEINILINNAAVQFPQSKIEDITSEQLKHTFELNIFSFFYLTQAVLPYLNKGGIIINSTSITAYKGSPYLIDYSSTKGAIVSFTRSLALSLLERGIRVNAVAPGPIWTPLIPASFSEEDVAEFGNQVPMKRAGQPYEIATSYVFLASDDSSYMTGQVLHPNGGVIVNG